MSAEGQGPFGRCDLIRGKPSSWQPINLFSSALTIPFFAIILWSWQYVGIIPEKKK